MDRVNLTLVVPNGTTTHGTENLICLPTKWTDVAAFFIVNYVAHAATIISRPGETWSETIFTTLNALFVPGSGIMRTLRNLAAAAAFTVRDEGRRAAKSRALCTWVKEAHATYYDGMKVKPDAWYTKTFLGTYRATALPPNRAVYGYATTDDDHGRALGDMGLLLIPLPADTPLRPYLSSAGDKDTLDMKKFKLSSSYNVPKVLAGLFQAVWGAVTLYKARGTQIDAYGYAAFGLSVAPYVVMSLMNIAAALVTPEYPVMYLVNSPDMDEARKRGRRFAGVIADIDVEHDGPPVGHASNGIVWSYILGPSITALVPLAIIGGMSHFNAGSASTASDRGWMMAWVVVGMVSAPWVRAFSVYGGYDGWVYEVLTFISVCPLWVPAIGGMVTVGKMLRDYGTCTRLDI